MSEEKSVNWQLILRIITVLFWLVSIVWVIVEPGFEPLLGFLGGTASLIGSFVVDGKRGGEVVGKRRWTCQIWNKFLDSIKATLVSLKTRFNNFRACLRGELDQCRVELETERNKFREEQVKVTKTTAVLATISQRVLGLCDESVEQADKLDWSGAIEVSKRADRFLDSALFHHVTKVVYYDPRSPASWMKGEIAELTRRFFIDRGFVEKDAEQLKDWINRVLDERRLGGENRVNKSLIVFAQDVVPDTVAEVCNESCLLRKYLDAGGRVVWRGDIPFWYQGKSSGAMDIWGPEGPQKILGIDYTNHDYALKPSGKHDGKIWDKPFLTQLTQAGYDIGLSFPEPTRFRPVSGKSVSISYLLIQPGTITLGPAVDWDGDNLALCWKKRFNDHHRHSGFMQYVTGEFLPNDVNDYFFRFAVSGWPLFFGS